MYYSHMNMNIHHPIGKVQFGILSKKDVLNMAVCEITHNKIANITENQNLNTVYDYRMGPLNTHDKCHTCNMNSLLCAGHFGYIKLNVEVVHPLYYKPVLLFLRCFCIECSHLLITEDHVDLWGISKLRDEKRFKYILAKIEKIKMCLYCNKPQPKFVFSSNEVMYYAIFPGTDGDVQLPLSVPEIKVIFERVNDTDLVLLGFNPAQTRPINFILEVLPVLPPRSRPFIISDNSICDDDLTIQYMEIVKANNHIVSDILGNNTKQNKYIQTLNFRIKTLYDNSGGKARHTNARQIKGIKERLCGKEGLIRSGLLGKRCCHPQTPILLYNGMIKLAKDIIIGDVLIGDDGKPCPVSYVHSGHDDMYKVIQKNGDDYIVNSEHLLSVKYTVSVRKERDKFRVCYVDNNIMTSKLFTSLSDAEWFRDMNCTNNILDISPVDYLELSVSKQAELRGFKLTTSIDWEYIPVDLDPYILGMWLGDGNSRGGGFASIDKELVDYWETWAYNNGISINPKGDNLHYNIHNNGSGYFKNCLKKYNLIENKHVPNEYLLNDTDTRLKLLAGMIDTDGYIVCRGVIEIQQCMKRSQLLNEIQFIARSLGFRTYMTVTTTSWTHKGIKKTGEAMRLNISGQIACIPTLLPRKKCINTVQTQAYKITIELMGYGEFVGFSVDNASNRFLLGDFTVTHNTNFSARTVIGPDASLRLDEIAIPPLIADILTYPENVNRHNIQELEELIKQGKANVVIRNDPKLGELKFTLKYILNKQKEFKLVQGDVVERKLRDNDIILLNRQPSLHRGSMAAMRIKVRPGNTIRMNLAVTGAFNADYDGDEMNLFTASSELSRAELEELSTPVNNMIGHQSGKPDVGIVQDGLTGAYLMTGGLTTSLDQADEEIPKHVFYNICAQLDNISSNHIIAKLKTIKEVYKKFNVDIPLFSGKSLFSMLLPDDFIYNTTNKADDRYSVNIYRGVMYKGVLTKAHLGKSHESIITILHTEYPINVVYDFVNNVQWMANHFLLYHGFSIGLADCVATKLDQIENACMKSFIEAEEIENSTTNEFIKEVKIGMALGKARDTGMKIAKEALDKTNNFLTTVSSGSKGDFFNIAQITGIVGQQNLGGTRMKYQMNHETRALPHYPMGKLDKPTEYESMGFIKSSFIKGLTPQEYWLHSVSSRESLTDKIVSVIVGCSIWLLR